MNPKTLIVMYGDKVILAVLALFLLYCLYVGFIASDPEEEKIGDEIQRLITDVKNMIDKNPPVIEVPKVAHLIKDQLSHTMVVNPYRSALFYPKEIRNWPPHPVTTVIERPTRIMFPGKIGRILEFDERFFKPEALPTKTYDEEKGRSFIQFVPRAPGKTIIQYEDDADNKWIAHLEITAKAERKPLPPTDLALRAVRGQVEITCMIRNPSPLPEGVAKAIGVDIWRRSARDPEAPSSYRKLNTDVVRPISREEVSETITGPPSPPSGAGTPPPPPSHAAPPVAVEEARRGVKGFCKFLDETVEPGEAYVYKVAALSDLLPPEQSDPIFTEEFLVPPDILFFLTNVIGNKLTFEIQKFDYNLQEWFRRRFQPPEGEIIGDKYPESVKDRSGKTIKQLVDFSTKAIVVRIAPEAIRYEAKIEFLRQFAKDSAGMPMVKKVVRLREIREPKVIIQDRKGVLREMWKTTPPLLPAKKPEQPGMPGLPDTGRPPEIPMLPQDR